MVYLVYLDIKRTISKLDNVYILIKSIINMDSDKKLVKFKNI